MFSLLRARPHWTAAAAAVLAAVVPLPAAAAPAAADSGGLRSEPVAPGVDLEAGESTGAQGPQYTTVLSVDLGAGTGLHYADSGRVAGADTVRSMASSVPPPRGTDVVAAVNGDFFDAGASLAPLGAAMAEGELLSSPTEDNVHAVVISESGKGAVREVGFEGTAALPGPDARIDVLNAHAVPDGGLGVFTSEWGEADRARAVRGADRVAEVAVRDGTVRSVRDSAGSGAIGEGTAVLVGSGDAAKRLSSLSEGDAVDVDHRLTGAGRAPETVVGGRRVLLRDGEPTGLSDGARHPRTAVGFSADGRTAYVIAADGRVDGARGSTLPDIAKLLKEAGAVDALALDGGGSSTMLARSSGGSDLELRNRTGEEVRKVSNGIVVTALSGEGREPAVSPEPSIER